MATRRRGVESPARKEGPKSHGSSMETSESEFEAAPPAPVVGGATKGQTAEQTRKAESKLSKLKTRLLFGTPLIGFFFVLVYMGHPYMVLLVCLLQVGLFRELVNVRYRPAKEKMVPLFRTCQWAMFGVAMSHVYGSIFVQLGLARSAMERMPQPFSDWMGFTIKYHSFCTFSGYICVLIGFVLSLRPGLYKYQVGNSVWTIGVLALVVWQINGTTELIFAGMCWFMLPCGLVVANDCFAYFCGLAAGRKFIKAPFLALSPNKTWEGFIGAFPCTAIWAFLYSGWISNASWLTCPQRNFDVFAAESLNCTVPPEFTPQPYAFPMEQLHLITLYAKPFQVHALILAAFASIVAPFGGFLASAFKRAYNIKDFDSLIPGHGGLMDRMDCQFLMLLCTNVHYRTFFRPYDISESDILSSIGTMSPEVRANFMERLCQQFTCPGS